MDALGGDMASGFRTVLSPFLLLTSCATLVWGLQTRYSRVVHSIRQLYRQWAGATGEGERETLRRELRILEGRARCQRNGVVGYYVAMGLFLVCAALLAAGTAPGFDLAWPAVASLFAGLVVVCWTLANVFLDALRSFDAIAEELRGEKHGPQPRDSD